MNPLEWLHFLTELLRKDAEVIGGFVLGIVTCIAFIGLLRWAFPKLLGGVPKVDFQAMQESTAKAQSHHETLAALLAEKEDRQQSLAEQILGLHAEVSTAHERSFADKADKERVQEETRALLESERLKWRTSLLQANENIDLANQQTLHQQKRRKETEKQLQSAQLVLKEIEDLQGRVWERPIQTEIPPFRPLEPGKPAIIALANLKGGVGKTSITANLAAAYWNQGKRVLLVDLDHQSSLSTMCLTPQQISELVTARTKSVRRLFEAKANFAQVAWGNVLPIPKTSSYILACDEELITAEEHAKARWLIRPTEGDVRYILREALHDPIFQDQFDIILLDCPPRLTSAAINAMTSADYVLVPALLDRTSTEGVPRLLNRLRTLKNQRICPDLSVLGIIGNRGYYKDKLSKREANLVYDLNQRCVGSWGPNVTVFDRTVPNTTTMAEITGGFANGDSNDAVLEVFSTLVQEIDHRRQIHESRRIAALV